MVMSNNIFLLSTNIYIYIYKGVIPKQSKTIRKIKSVSKYSVLIDKSTRTLKQYSYAYNFSKMKAAFAFYLFWSGLPSRYNISGSLMFLHQRRTHKQQILMLEISHIIFFLFQPFLVFNKIFLGLLQSPVTKNDHSKSSFDGFHYYKMISHSRPISRKLKSFKV